MRPLRADDKKKQILRLTNHELHSTDEDLSAGTPGLKDAWGPVRSGWQLFSDAGFERPR